MQRSGILGGVIEPGKAFDYIAFAYPNATTEVITFKEGGASGTTLAVITIVYTDANKLLISTVSRS